MRRAPIGRIIPYVIGGSLLVGSIALHLHSRHERAFAAAFLLGACCHLLFHQWRQQGDTAARAWCLAGVALWAPTVAVTSFDDSAAAPVAGLAGPVGVAGALTTLVRTARLRGEPAPTTPDD
ncbi:hypothetical protein ACH4S8_06155 [Streptomyces sp. NPDC021080]|uniref:hypothetical protein n=1 Tax=Streptomyces sp. NPDC021080 TaxID=3365110 RepID=UPI0037901726